MIILPAMQANVQEVYEHARRPSPESWRLICEALDTMPLTLASRVLLRLKKFLAVWPDELRATMCGMSWDDKFLEGKPDPRSIIVRHLRLDRIFTGRYGRFMIRSVRLTPEALQRLGSSRGSRHLTMLTISSNDVGTTGMRQLAQGENLTSLRHLKADRCSLGRGGFEALMQARFLPQLESLSLTSNAIKAQALDVLTTMTTPVALKSLSLDDNPIERLGAAFLASTPIFSSLTNLSLRDCSLGPEGAAEIADGMFPKLEELDLSRNQLGDEGLAALAARPLPIRSLELNEDTIGIDGCRALTHSSWSLERLSLRENRIGDAEMQLLAETKWPKLKELILDDNDVTPAGLERILASPTLESLTTLSLGTNLIGPQSFAKAGPAARRLQKIVLRYNRVSHDGLAAFCRIPWEKMRELDLAQNGIHAGGLEHLMRAPFFDKLEDLDLGNNPLTDATPKLVWPSRLERLDLSHTGVGDLVVEALAASPCRPKNLLLSGCGLTDRAAYALAESPILERIERLILDENAITTGGAYALARALSGRDVRVLSLENNQIDDIGAEGIAEFPSLVVYLDENPYGEKGRAALAKMPVRCCP